MPRLLLYGNDGNSIAYATVDKVLRKHRLWFIVCINKIIVNKKQVSSQLYKVMVGLLGVCLVRIVYYKAVQAGFLYITSPFILSHLEFSRRAASDKKSR